MKVIGDHKIEFIFENEDEKIELPIVTDPIYIYGIGDRFKIIDITDDESKSVEYEVVKIENEILFMLEGEQKIILTIKKAD